MEESHGSVFFEVEIFLKSDSGRPKHLDHNEQGGWIVDQVADLLRSLPHGGDIELGQLRYWGDRCKPVGDPITARKIGDPDSL